MDQDAVKRDVEKGDTTVFDDIDPQKHLGRLENSIPLLVCLKGSLFQEPLVIQKALMSLGRLPQCDLYLNQGNVSRVHAFLRLDERGPAPVCTIRDNASRNGTFVNGARIKHETELRHGDTILIGDFVLGYYLRREAEVVMERRVTEALSRYGQSLRTGRIPADVPVRLRILIPEETFTPKIIEGRAKDLSTNGMRFVTEEVSQDLFSRLLTGKRHVRCEIHLPDTTADMMLNARVAWLHFDNRIKPELCSLGLEFRNVPAEAQEALSERLSRSEAEPLQQDGQ
jgi:hypothetical protein